MVAAADLDQRKTHYTAQLQSGHAHLRPEILFLQRIKRHGQQLTPAVQSFLNQSPGNTQVGRVDLFAVTLPRHRNVETFVLAQQQKASLTGGYGQGRIHHRDQHFLGGERVMNRARHLHQGAQLRKRIVAHAAGMGRRREVFQHLRDLPGLQRNGDLVGILHAKADAVQVVQQVALYAMAVHPGSVAAVQVLKDILIVFLNDACVAAGSPVVAQDQVIVGLAADQKRKLVQVHARTLAGGIEDKESSAFLGFSGFERYLCWHFA